MRPCAVRWSFLAGLQRLVLPGRLLKAGPPSKAFKGCCPSKAGPPWKAFKGWSFLEGLQRLILPGRPSKAGHSWKAFRSALLLLLQHSLLFLQSRLEASPLLLPGTGSFLLPSFSRRGCRRSEKGSGNMSLQRAKFSVFKSLRSLVLPLGARPRPAVSSPTQSGLTVRNLHGVNDRILVSPPATSSRVHPQDLQEVQVLVSPWQSLPAPARPSINA